MGVYKMYYCTWYVLLQLKQKPPVLNIYYLKILTGFDIDTLMNLKMVIMIKTKQDLKGYRFLTFSLRRATEA